MARKYFINTSKPNTWPKTCKRNHGKYSPNIGQSVPSGSEVVVAPQLAYAPLFGLHLGLCSCGGTGDHVVLVSRCTCRGDASARSPTRSAASTAARGWRFLLVRPTDRQRGPILPTKGYTARVGAVYSSVSRSCLIGRRIPFRTIRSARLLVGSFWNLG